MGTCLHGVEHCVRVHWIGQHTVVLGLESQGLEGVEARVGDLRGRLAVARVEHLHHVQAADIGRQWDYALVFGMEKERRGLSDQQNTFLIGPGVSTLNTLENFGIP